MATLSWCPTCGRTCVFNLADHKRYCQGEPATVRTLLLREFSLKELHAAIERDFANRYPEDQRIRVGIVRDMHAILAVSMVEPEEVVLQRELEAAQKALQELEQKQVAERAGLQRQIELLSKGLSK
jgi:hypothetical protein